MGSSMFHRVARMHARQQASGSVWRFAREPESNVAIRVWPMPIVWGILIADSDKLLHKGLVDCTALMLLLLVAGRWFRMQTATNPTCNPYRMLPSVRPNMLAVILMADVSGSNACASMGSVFNSDTAQPWSTWRLWLAGVPRSRWLPSAPGISREWAAAACVRFSGDGAGPCQHLRPHHPSNPDGCCQVHPQMP